GGECASRRTPDRQAPLLSSESPIAVGGVERCDTAFVRGSTPILFPSFLDSPGDGARTRPRGPPWPDPAPPCVRAHRRVAALRRRASWGAAAAPAVSPESTPASTFHPCPCAGVPGGIRHRPAPRPH